jgi:serine/threonine-protein kinase RsbW
MSTSQHTIELKIPASSEFISIVRLALSGVANRLEFTVEAIEDIKIALSEACTNVIQHAFHDPEKECIYVTFKLDEGSLEMTVKDTGKGFSPGDKAVDKSNPEQDGKFGLGLGLVFIRTLMDEVVLDSEIGKGTLIRMKKFVSKSH